MTHSPFRTDGVSTLTDFFLRFLVTYLDSSFLLLFSAVDPFRSDESWSYDVDDFLQWIFFPSIRRRSQGSVDCNGAERVPDAKSSAGATTDWLALIDVDGRSPGNCSDLQTLIDILTHERILDSPHTQPCFIPTKKTVNYRTFRIRKESSEGRTGKKKMCQLDPRVSIVNEHKVRNLSRDRQLAGVGSC